MKSKFTLLAIFISSFAFAGDTTSTAYRIGYAMGEFLPFVLMAIIFIWLMWRRYNKSR
jgi:hypothetical protein